MNIYEYAKLSKGEKEQLLNNDALFLEQYNDSESTIHVYYLNGFFVEVTVKEGKIIDNIPYKSGYKLNKNEIHNLEKRNCMYHLAA